MIPIRLKMRNFMPYREAEVDFSGIHLAVITGDNGNGKSAIIDAMTWALWGKARGSDTRELGDDALIHASQAEMEVEFEFDAGGQVYRIIRKRARPKKKTGAGQSGLELQVKSPDGFRPITGNTIAQTQDKIIDAVLHMGYETFINSAYLRQGHADEFTTRNPAERKEVLSKILGLEVYDALEVKAREQARSYEVDNARLQNTISETNNELAHRPEFAAELEKAEAALKTAETLAKEKEAALNLLRQRRDLLERTEAQIKEIQEDIQSKTNDQKKWQEQSAQHLAHIAKYEETLIRREEIEAGYANFVSVKKTVEDLDRKAMQSRALDKQREQLERKVDQEKNELLRRHAVISNGIQELEKRLQALPLLKTQLAQAQAVMPGLKKNEEAISSREHLVQEIQTEINRLEAENGQWEKDIKNAQDKLDLISRHTADHIEKCPLCNQDLTREALELIREKSTGEIQVKTAQIARNRETLAKKRGEYTVAQREKAALEAAFNQEKTRAHSQEELIKARIKEIEGEAQNLAECKQEAGEIEERLAGCSFAVAEQTALTAIEKELAALGYDTAKHEQAHQQLQQAAPFERDKNALDEAIRLMEQEKSAAARAQDAAKGLQESLERSRQKKEKLAEELIAAPRVRQELAAAEAEHTAISRQCSGAQEAVGHVRARLQRLADLEIKKKEDEDRLAQTAREQDIYRELARAFGKNGIQALIIDTVRPEIEDEANKLLARLTDNRMTVKIETQRQIKTKKDTLKETLDIIIADELGTRNYEMFSGGEAFRINFAIRIALSRLLARRAGAPLPTIIIDEGFGTQDNTGMEKLKEAIISIQDDFQKILVITHMDELKDAFPARIDVVKTADGSIITVN